MWVLIILLWAQNSAGDGVFFFFLLVCVTEALPALYNVWWFLSRWCRGIIKPTAVGEFSVSCHRSTNMIMDGAIFRDFQKLLPEAHKWIFSRASGMAVMSVGPPPPSVGLD